MVYDNKKIDSFSTTYFFIDSILLIKPINIMDTINPIIINNIGLLVATIILDHISTPIILDISELKFNGNLTINSRSFRKNDSKLLNINSPKKNNRTLICQFFLIVNFLSGYIVNYTLNSRI